MVHEIPKDTIADQHDSQITQARWYMLVFSLSSFPSFQAPSKPFLRGRPARGWGEGESTVITL